MTFTSFLMTEKYVFFVRESNLLIDAITNVYIR